MTDKQKKRPKDRIADAAEFAAAKTRQALDSAKETSQEVVDSAQRGWKAAHKPEL